MLCKKTGPKGERRRLFRAALRIIVLAGFASGAMGQAQTACETQLAEAEQRFYAANFDEALALAEGCLNQSNLSAAMQVQAYRLKAMIYQAKDYIYQAKEAIRKLLQLVPNYQPDPVEDQPRFVELVEQVRAEGRRAPLAPQPATPDTVAIPQKKKGGAMKWLWLGGGLGAVTIAAAILAGGSGDNSPPSTPRPSSLPTPPTLP